jgi:hypothetical protein
VKFFTSTIPNHKNGALKISLPCDCNIRNVEFTDCDISLKYQHILPWYDGNEKIAKSYAAWSIKSSSPARKINWQNKIPYANMDISKEILRVVEQIKNTLFWQIIMMIMYVMIVIFVSCFETRSLA